jgi:hypothetical protein
LLHHIELAFLIAKKSPKPVQGKKDLIPKVFQILKELFLPFL